MRLLLLIAFVLIGDHVLSQIPVSKKYFRVESATQRKWMPGIVQKNSSKAGGVIYEIKIRIRRNFSPQFESLLTDNQSIKLEVVKGTERGARGPFLKGDILTLVGRRDVSEPAVPIFSEWAAAIAKEKKREAWLVFVVKDKPCLFGISKIQEVAASANN